MGVPWAGICAVSLLGVILINSNDIFRAGDDEFKDAHELDETTSDHNHFSFFSRVLLFGFGGLACVFISLVFNQRSLVYRPIVRTLPRVGNAHPLSYGLKHKDLFIRSADGTQLHAWILYKSEEDAELKPAVLFLHSNAGDISQRLEFFKGLCYNIGFVVLALEYRGFGRSEDGNGWCEEAFVHDAFAAYEWLRSFASMDDSPIDPNRLFIFGRSIGGAVSMRLVAHLLGADPAATAPCRMQCSKPRLPLPAGLILENTFSSFAEVARHILPLLRVLPRCILARPIVRDEWRSVEWLAWIGQQLAFDLHRDSRMSLCFLSAARDVVVSPKCMDVLKDVAEASKSWHKVAFHRFPRSGHMDTWRTGGPSYWSSLRALVAVKSD